MSTQPNTLNGAILDGLYRAIELVEFANAAGRRLKGVKVTNDEPLLIFANADDEPARR